MYWYNFIKEKFIWFLMLSNHDNDTLFVWKIEDYNILLNNNDFLNYSKWITEFYYFKTDINNVNNIFSLYFDKNILNNSKNLLVINTNYDIYKSILDKNELYLVYSLDILNKDFTFYLKFFNIEKLSIFLNKNSSTLNKNFINLKDRFIKFQDFFSNFYFKIKLKNNWDISYSIVFDFKDFSWVYSLEDFLMLLNINDYSIIDKFKILYNNNKYIEVSYDLNSFKCENIYFFEK